MNSVFSGGGNWSEGGNIIAATANLGPLSWIPAAGGAPHPLTKLGAGEVTHRWPQDLPGGNANLFTASPTAAVMDNASIEAISVKTGHITILQRGG